MQRGHVWIVDKKQHAEALVGIGLRVAGIATHRRLRQLHRRSIWRAQDENAALRHRIAGLIRKSQRTPFARRGKPHLVRQRSFTAFNAPYNGRRGGIGGRGAVDKITHTLFQFGLGQRAQWLDCVESQVHWW